VRAHHLLGDWQKKTGKDWHDHRVSLVEAWDQEIAIGAPEIAIA
jgi:hypothetical protein